jgi:hypothetical protein
LVRNLSAFSTLFAPGKSWDNGRSTAAPYTESRLAHLVRNKCVGFPVVEQSSFSTFGHKTRRFRTGLGRAELNLALYFSAINFAVV